MAAVLHDVIEDTEVGPGRLREADLPEDVVAAVVALTHRPDESYEQFIEKVACDGLAREVKLADLADNLANNRHLAGTPDVVARIDRHEQAVRRLHIAAPADAIEGQAGWCVREAQAGGRIALGVRGQTLAVGTLVFRA